VPSSKKLDWPGPSSHHRVSSNRVCGHGSGGTGDLGEGIRSSVARRDSIHRCRVRGWQDLGVSWQKKWIERVQCQINVIVLHMPQFFTQCFEDDKLR
jgi:hypothetical protein